jgi:hypothetical protein
VWRYLNMGIAVIPAASSGMTTTRFPAAIGNPFNIPAGLTLQNTVTTTTTFTAGQLPAQVWVVMMGAGGAGGSGTSYAGGGGGGGACIGWVDVPSAGITATIGAGGAGVAASDSGNPGGNTSFGTLTAFGGGGGAIGSGSLLDTWQVYPRGTGAGYGGSSNTSGSTAGTDTAYRIINGSAPFVNSGSMLVSGGSQTNTYGGLWSRVQQAHANNYFGGGAGGCQSFLSGLPGNGLSGGGAQGQNPQAGGNSSRNAGVTNTFTGGAAGSTASGGGAGLLANGSAGSTNGGNGGSGGGGGGGATSGTSGSGGNGCVLIYY